jgi:hypothetical protein
MWGGGRRAFLVAPPPAHRWCGATSVLPQSVGAQRWQLNRAISSSAQPRFRDCGVGPAWLRRSAQRGLFSWLKGGGKDAYHAPLHCLSLLFIFYFNLVILIIKIKIKIKIRCRVWVPVQAEEAERRGRCSCPRVAGQGSGRAAHAPVRGPATDTP